MVSLEKFEQKNKLRFSVIRLKVINPVNTVAQYISYGFTARKYKVYTITL